MINLHPIRDTNGTAQDNLRMLRELNRRIQMLGIIPGNTIEHRQTSAGVMLNVKQNPRRPDEMFPFRVYPSPSGNTDAETIDGWRKVLVRSGRVGTVEVTGTDGAEYPYSREAGVTAGEITITDAEDEYVIWIAYQPDTANSGASASAAIDHGATGWTSYPAQYDTEGTIMIPIALCDTTTSGVLKIRQLVDNDLPNFMQVCVTVSGVEKVLNIPCLGYPFEFGT